MNFTSQTPGPSLAWDFDGTTVPYIGSVSSTTIRGTLTYTTPGKYTQTLNIQNPSGTTSNSINWNFGASFSVDNGFSFSFWTRINSLSYLVNIQRIITFYNNTSNPLRIQLSTSGNMQFQFNDSVGQKNVNMFTPSVGAWYHIALIGSSGGITVYVNGTTTYGPMTYVQTGITFNNAALGLATDFTGYPLTNADFDDLRIYNTALSAAQVQAIYRANGIPSRWTGRAVGLGSMTIQKATNGLTAELAAPNAMYIKTYFPDYGDGVYWINCNGTPTQTYCLMDPKWDGGGWMLIMKAAQGSTFNWNANYWTTTNTLNPTDTTTNVADAKFEAFNSVPITDVMAVWPTSDIGAANVGGSLNVPEGWVWLVKGWYTSAITGLAGFQIDRDAIPADIFQFSGFSTTSPIWSYQSGTRAHVFGSGAHIAGPDTYITRWGFLWNNEVNTTSTQDAFAGIGLNTPVSSGGDFYFWTGTQKKGFNRNIAWLLYGR